MKTNRIFLIAFFAFFCVSLNAQVFVGGNFSLNTSGGSTTNGAVKTDRPSSFNFDLMPKAGIFLSEKLAAGAALDLSFSMNKTPGTPEITSKSSTIGIIPFLRYYALKIDKFSVFGQGNVGLSFSNSSSNGDVVSTTGPKVTRIYVNLFPGLAYDLSDKLSLETTLNFLSLGYYNTTSKTSSSKNITSSFGVGAGLDNIVTVGNISIGAIYKF